MKHHEKHHEGHHMARHAEHMKHGGRKHRATGGVNDAEMDLRDKPMEYGHGNPEKEAEERKRGGRVKHHPDCRCHKCMGGKAKRKHGGHVMHKGFGPEDEPTARKHGGHVKHHRPKHMGEEHRVHGEHERHRADRKPRKAGGRTGSDSHPYTSAHRGEPPKGRDLDMEME